jgi:hypothetical protein
MVGSVAEFITLPRPGTFGLQFFGLFKKTSVAGVINWLGELDIGGDGIFRVGLHLLFYVNISCSWYCM